VYLRTYDKANQNCFFNVYIYDGSNWTFAGKIYGAGWGDGYWKNSELNVTGILDTVIKINNARVYFSVGNTGATSWIANCWLYVKGSEFAYSSDANQQADDYFIVNLGDSYDRVTGTYVESRLHDSMYARNYTVQYTTLSDCCADNVVDNDNLWSDFTPAVNVYR